MAQTKRHAHGASRAAAGAAGFDLKSTRFAAAATLVSLAGLIAMFLVSMLAPEPLRWMDSGVLRGFLGIGIALEVLMAIELAWGPDAEDE